MTEVSGSAIKWILIAICITIIIMIFPGRISEASGTILTAACKYTGTQQICEKMSIKGSTARSECSLKAENERSFSWKNAMIKVQYAYTDKDIAGCFNTYNAQLGSNPAITTQSIKTELYRKISADAVWPVAECVRTRLRDDAFIEGTHLAADPNRGVRDQAISSCTEALGISIDEQGRSKIKDILDSRASMDQARVSVNIISCIKRKYLMPKNTEYPIVGRFSLDVMPQPIYTADPKVRAEVIYNHMIKVGTGDITHQYVKELTSEDVYFTPFIKIRMGECNMEDDAYVCNVQAQYVDLATTPDALDKPFIAGPFTFTKTGSEILAQASVGSKARTTGKTTPNTCLATGFADERFQSLLGLVAYDLDGTYQFLFKPSYESPCCNYPSRCGGFELGTCDILAAKAKGCTITKSSIGDNRFVCG